MGAIRYGKAKNSMTAPPAGWYDDPTTPGRLRWFDGTQWTDHYQSAPVIPQHQYQQPQYSTGPMTASQLNVRREVVYNRPQVRHSLTLWLLISFITAGLGLIWVLYYSVSPNHYWSF